MAAAVANDGSMANQLFSTTSFAFFLLNFARPTLHMGIANIFMIDYGNGKSENIRRNGYVCGVCALRIHECVCVCLR